jgi:adenine-specific DNA methylase
MRSWSSVHLGLLGQESFEHFVTYQKSPYLLDDLMNLRNALLDFIADFSNWDNSTIEEYLKTSASITRAAHQAMGRIPGSRPIVADPFAGGGSIPLEALRIGADTFASDLNPISVLLNKIILEYIPKFGGSLVEEVRTWGDRIKQGVEKELEMFYPKDPDGSTPVAYLWARTIQCEGPNCGAEVPLIRSLWLAKKGSRFIALKLEPNQVAKRVDFKIIVKKRDGWVDQSDSNIKILDPIFDGPMKRSSATCPCCGFTTPPASVQRQLRLQHGGADNAIMTSVVTTTPSQQGRSFRLPTIRDHKIVEQARQELQRRKAIGTAFIPEETLPLMSGVFNAPIYGHNTWASVFTSRQNLALSTLVEHVLQAYKTIARDNPDIAPALIAVLSLGVSKIADISNSLVIWKASMSQAIHLFTRQAIPMLWDFAETSLLSDAAGDYATTIGNISRVLDHEINKYDSGHAVQASATHHPLPDNSVSAFVTDPPYYNAIPYADLSDFFYVWLRYMLKVPFPELFSDVLAPKAEEICEMSGWDRSRYAHKNGSWFESKMAEAMSEGRRVLEPSGIGVVVFAHKTTRGWEAQLQAMIDAGWIITASWPIDTELGNRLRARNSAVLGSSVHLVCRPREHTNGSLPEAEVGDWREILQELPRRIHEWMPHLAAEGVVGADAIFACIGPALEIFSKYSRVEKASGEVVSLRDYLEHVWATVAKEAMTLVFQGASAEGFEPDARLTAMWLWTLGTVEDDKESVQIDGELDSDEDEAEVSAKKVTGFVLEFDAARKIAQGLGANLDDLSSLVEVKGDSARMVSVAERASYLFGKQVSSQTVTRTRGRQKQKALPGFEEIVEESVGFGLGANSRKLGQTVLDRIHQSMLLFGSGRGEALKTFLVDEGVGSDPRFWRLAQALSALYPRPTQEKRWVDGVLSRKKSFGF